MRTCRWNGARGRERLRHLLVALVAVAAVQAALALPPGPPDAHGGAAATRGVAKYLGLERALAQAVADHDRAALGDLLGEGFEVRPSAGADAIDGATWVDGALRSATRDPVVVSGLGLREFDDLAVVSFVQLPAAAARRPARKTGLFVVDVWRTSTGRLLARYTSELRGDAQVPAIIRGRE